ncbi:alpha-rhamnosidase [Clostridia bacterium]|nr:alpha-rhamnosidase [Clostridia bacterium]
MDKQNKKAEWIWYPDDFEFMLANKVMTRRYQREVFIPPYWRLEQPNCNLKFYRDFELTKENVFTVKADGRFNIIINKKGEAGDNFIPVAAKPFAVAKGQWSMCISVYNDTGLPCLFVDSEEVKSGPGFTVSDGNYGQPACGCDGFFDADISPNQYTLPVEEIGYVSKERLSDTKRLYDFGRETFAFLKILGVKNSREITIFYGESRTEALDFENCELFEKVQITPDNAVTGYARGFRFAVIDFGGLLFDDICGLFEFAPIESKAFFQSGDSKLNDIYRTAEYTFLLNSREFYIDGIKRDRWLWSGDATQSYLMSFYTSYDIRIMRRTITALGGKQPVKTFLNGLVDYTLFWILSMWDYYMYTGDSEFVRSKFPLMQAMTEFYKTRINENGLLQGIEKDYTFIDHAVKGSADEISALQILYAKALLVMGDFCELFGIENDYHARSQAVMKKTRALYWDADKGCFYHSRVKGQLDGRITKHANIFAVLYGLVTSAEKEKILRGVLLNDEVEKITSPYIKFYEYAALCETGCHEIVMNEIKAYWGGMLNEGATAFWEEYNPLEKGAEKYAMYGRPYGKSLCHAWGASPLYLIGRYMLGLYPATAGYGSFVLQPALQVLGGTKSRMPTLNGFVELEFKGGVLKVYASKDGGELRLQSGWCANPPAEGRLIDGCCRYEIQAGKRYEFLLRDEL